MEEKFEIIKEIIKEQNAEVMFLEEKFDKALIGTARTYGGKFIAAYSSEECIKILIDEGMSELEAFEHFDGNLSVQCPNENTPVFISDFRTITEVIVNEADAISDIISGIDGMKYNNESFKEEKDD